MAGLSRISILDSPLALPYSAAAFTMPLIASAIKRARQNEVRRQRILPYRTHMKTAIRSVMDLVKQGKKDEARSLLPMTYKAIDIAAKKYVIHWKTAARRKSRIAGLVG